MAKHFKGGKMVRETRADIDARKFRHELGKRASEAKHSALKAAQGGKRLTRHDERLNRQSKKHG